MDFGNSSSGGRKLSAAGLAKVVAGAMIIGVFAADVLATWAERGSLPRLSLEWPNSVGGLKAGNRSEVIAAYRGAGIDGTATSTIPKAKPDAGGFKRDAAALSPCGELEP